MAQPELFGQASCAAGGQRQVAAARPHLQDAVQALGRDHQADGAEGGQADAMLGDPAQRFAASAPTRKIGWQVGAGLWLTAMRGCTRLRGERTEVLLNNLSVGEGSAVVSSAPPSWEAGVPQRRQWQRVATVVDRQRVAANAGITAHNRKVAVSPASVEPRVPAQYPGLVGLGTRGRARVIAPDRRPPVAGRPVRVVGQRAGAQVQPGIEGLPDITELVLVIAPVHLHQPDVRPFARGQESARGVRRPSACCQSRKAGRSRSSPRVGECLDRPCAGACSVIAIANRMLGWHAIVHQCRRWRQAVK